ncbi:MAG: hypothetical protein AAGF01_10910 [Cyanobacteria bacterium P01_G01_bin.38]
MSRTHITQIFSVRRLATMALSLTAAVFAIGSRSAQANEAHLPEASPQAVVLSIPSTLAQIQSVILDLHQIPIDMTPSTAEIQAGVAVTEDTTSETDFTRPSLWWQHHQSSLFVETDQLISGWVAYRRDGLDALHHIDLDLNRRLWNSLNYIEQYALITQFGQTAKSYGYQLRLFTGESLVGAYVCNFTSTIEAASIDPSSTDSSNKQVGLATENRHKNEVSTETLDEISCAVSLDYLGRSSVRGRGANPLGQP